ncbi:hypothetical protein, partial [Bradyrhizobium liaoningense]|uniref:hypothetical protein n=1 Tax=Bradyrhizobium liaoningense TaxID=43992 RepID=UPI001BAB7A19
VFPAPSDKEGDMTAQDSGRNCRETTALCPVSQKRANLSNSIGIADANGAAKRHYSCPILREKILAQ